MIISAKSDMGLVRRQNQDCFAAGELPDEVAWAVVCDGMGGAQGGSIASKIAVDIISDKIKKCYTKNMSAKSVKNLIISAIEGSNISIFDTAKKDEKLDGMGTTAVVTVIDETRVFIAHAGDSRAYLVNKAGIRQLTTDHSVVQAMVENGELSADEAKKHPQRNIITRALGVAESISIDFLEEMIENGDSIIMCTDGLTNFVDTPEIFEMFLSVNPKIISEVLVKLANKNGGGDNVTVVAISNTADKGA